MEQESLLRRLRTAFRRRGEQRAAPTPSSLSKIRENSDAFIAVSWDERNISNVEISIRARRDSAAFLNFLNRIIALRVESVPTKTIEKKNAGLDGWLPSAALSLTIDPQTKETRATLVNVGGTLSKEAFFWVQQVALRKKFRLPLMQ